MAAAYEKSDGQTFLVFRCPVCGPSRRFLTEVELRRHVEHRHPWRQLPSHSLLQLPLGEDFDDRSSLTDSFSGDEAASRIKYSRTNGKSPRSVLQASMTPKYIPATTSMQDADSFGFSRDAYIDWLHSPGKNHRLARAGRNIHSNREQRTDNEIEFLNKRMEGLASARKELARETLIMVRSLKHGPQYVDRMGEAERKRIRDAEKYEARLSLDDYMRGFRSRLDAVEKDALNLKSHLRGGGENGFEGSGLSPDMIHTTPHRPIARHSNKYLEPLNRGYTSDNGHDSPIYNGNSRVLAIGNGRSHSERDLEMSSVHNDQDRVFQWPPIYQAAIDSPRRTKSPHYTSLIPSTGSAFSMRPPLSRDSSLTSTDNEATQPTPSFPLSRRGLAIRDAMMNDPRRLRLFNALHSVFRFLDTRSLARAGRVSKLWYLASRQSDLWIRVRIRRVCMAYGMLTIMTKWCSQVQELTLENIRPSKAARQVSGALESGFEKFLKANSATMKTVRIINCGDLLSERCLWLVSVQCPKLESLTYLSENDSVGEEVICALKRGCPQITTLVIPPGYPCQSPDKFNDLCCQLIAQHWSMLQILCIGGRNLTESALSAIASSCPKIFHLELDHGPEISEGLAGRLVNQGLRGLEKLDFTFTPVSPRAVLLFINACPKIERVGVHIGITDYFPDHLENASRRGEFKALVIAFEQLLARQNLRKLLDIRLDYG